MQAYRSQVGARLRDLRKRKNWSQEDAAHAVGVTSATWGRWERGRTSPYDANWKKIEQAFDVDAAEVRGAPPTPLGLGAAAGDTPDVLALLEAQERRLTTIEEKLDRLLDQRMKLEERVRTFNAEEAIEYLTTLQEWAAQAARDVGLRGPRHARVEGHPREAA